MSGGWGCWRGLFRSVKCSKCAARVLFVGVVVGCDGRYESYTFAAVLVGEGEEMWGMGILVGGKWLQVVGVGYMIWSG